MTNKPNEGQKVTGEVDTKEERCCTGCGKPTKELEVIVAIIGNFFMCHSCIITAANIVANGTSGDLRDRFIAALPPKPVQDELETLREERDMWKEQHGIVVDLAGERMTERDNCLRQCVEALEPFARMAKKNIGSATPDDNGCPIVMSVREMRAAIAALTAAREQMKEGV